MTQQRYSIKEAVNRLYRLFTGQTPPLDSPNTLPGTVFSTDEAVSYLAEVFAGSMPDVTGTFPPGLLPINTPDDYILGKHAGVFGYLSTGTSTVLASGSFSTWYPIIGPFINDPFEDFTIQEDTITFTGDRPLWFEIDWHATVSVGAGNATIRIGISQNGTIASPSVMETYVAALKLQMSGTDVLLISPGDTIGLVMSAEADSETIIVSRFTTTIRMFFH